MRRVKVPVPMLLAIRRAVAFLGEQPRGYLSKASSVGYRIWPGVEFHSQGAGAAASRILKRAELNGLVEWAVTPNDWGWRITPTGRAWLTETEK